MPNDDGCADLTGHDAFVQAAPRITCARLPREDPMHWTAHVQGQSFRSVTRHEDILRLNGQPELLSSARGIPMEDQRHEEQLAHRTF